MPRSLFVPGSIGLLSLLLAGAAAAVTVSNATSGLELRSGESIGFDLAAPDQYQALGLLAPSLTAEEADRRFEEEGSTAALHAFAAGKRSGGAANGLAPYLDALARALRKDLDAESLTPLDVDDGPARFYMPLIRSLLAKDAGDVGSAMQQAQQALTARGQHPFARNLMGQLLASEGRYDEARTQFEMALRSAPSFADALANLAAVFYVQGDTLGALKMFDRALAAAPGSCQALLGRSAVLIERGDLARAAQGLETCAATPGYERKATVRMISLAVAQDDLEKAAQLAVKLSGVDPDLGSYWIAEIAMRRGEVELAAKQLAALPASNVQGRYLAAYVAAARGDMTEAKKLAREVIGRVGQQSGPVYAAAVFAFADTSGTGAQQSTGLAESSDPGWSFLAACRAAANDETRRAVERWRDSTGVVPGFDLSGASAAGLQRAASDHGQEELALALLFYKKRYLPTAQSFIDLAERGNPDSVVALLIKSIIQVGRGDTLGAQHSVQRMLTLEPRLFAALYQAAEYALGRARHEEARQLYRRAIAEKADAGAMLKLALLADAANDLSEVEKVMRAYIRTYPEQFVGYSQLAWFFAKRETNLDEAFSLAKHADSLQPGNVSVLDTLGWIRLVQGSLDEAAHYLEAADRAAGGLHPDVVYHLAVLAHRRGNREQARTLLHKALSARSGFESRGAAVALLEQLDTN